jgi:hypothetical protein
MRSGTAWLAAIVFSGAMVLSACNSSSTPDTSSPAAGTGATTPAATSNPGANPTSDFCTQLKTENAKFAQLGKTFGAAIASHDFATTKQTLATYFSAVAQAMSEVEASMSSAPADVQAALQTVNQYFSQLQSEIANASSLKQLETSLAAQGNSAQLKAAGATLSAYSKSQCGDLSTPSP